MLALFRTVTMLQPNESAEAARQIALGVLIRVPHVSACLGEGVAPRGAPGCELQHAALTNGGESRLPLPATETAQASHGHAAPRQPPPSAAGVDGRPSAAAAAELLGAGDAGRGTPAAAPAVDPLSTPVWTAGQVRRIAPFCEHAAYALERLDWRGPKAWRPRLSAQQLEALRIMKGQ